MMGNDNANRNANVLSNTRTWCRMYTAWIYVSNNHWKKAGWAAKWAQVQTCLSTSFANPLLSCGQKLEKDILKVAKINERARIKENK